MRKAYVMSLVLYIIFQFLQNFTASKFSSKKKKKEKRIKSASKFKWPSKYNQRAPKILNQKRKRKKAQLVALIKRAIIKITYYINLYWANGDIFVLFKICIICPKQHYLYLLCIIHMMTLLQNFIFISKKFKTRNFFSYG